MFYLVPCESVETNPSPSSFILLVVSFSSLLMIESLLMVSENVSLSWYTSELY